MKKIILFIVGLLVFSGVLHAQQDSLYIYKNKQIIWKEAINKVDSITFKEVTDFPPAQAVLFNFKFKKSSNDFLLQDYDLNIQNKNITGTIPLISRNLVASFDTDPSNKVMVNGRKQISGVSVNDFSKPVTYTITTDEGETANYTVDVSWLRDLPSINITTVNGEFVDVNNKSKKIRCLVEVDGKGIYPNFADSAGIRGRGNTTWGMPKKPFRFDLDKDASVLGYLPAKKWILLAEYLDPTLLLNNVAFKAGQLLEMPFTHHATPVTVNFNGEFLGVYTFTEHKEVHKNRINIDKKDGVLFEMDTYFDEDYKFYSSKYKLPVMFASPDLGKIEDEDERNAKFNLFKGYFEEMEAALHSNSFPNNNYKDLLDIESFVDYILLYDLTLNMEINHPKSTYLYKDKNEKFHMGPIWDFDWGFGYEGAGKHFSRYNTPLLLNQNVLNGKGTTFFKRFFDDPEFRSLYKQTWQEFRVNKLPLLIQHLEDVASSVAIYQPQDYLKWGGTSDYEAKIDEFITWLNNRANYLDTFTVNW